MIKKKNNEIHLHQIEKRTNVILGIVFILFSILLINYFKIQIINGTENADKAYNNTVRKVTMEPLRGLIYDRNNNVIADNIIQFDLNIRPENIENYGGLRDIRKEKLIKFLIEIESILKIDMDIENIVKRALSKQSFQKTKIYSSFDSDEVGHLINLVEHKEGIEMGTSIVRHYQYEDLFFHSLGYVGKPNKKELDESEFITRNSMVGKAGIEKYYDEYLHGESGLKDIIINASGRVKSEDIKKMPVSGKDLQVSLDLDLQALIKNKFKDKKGVAVVLDVNTGDIIAYYSAPSVNANKFSKGMSSKDYVNILNNPGSPLLNRITHGLYPPASTIKPFIAVGAIMGDYIDPNEEIFSAATYRVGDQIFKEWQNWGHGDIDMRRSLSRSSNYYYYDLGYQMGVDYMHDLLSVFGFGEKTPILEVDGMKTGINPSNEWKIKTYGERFYKGEEIMISIGSGNISASPIQMANAIKLIANGGKQYELKFNYKKDKRLVKDLNLNEDWLNPVRGGLYDTVNTKDGTGRVIRKKTDVIVAGKTGTAQVFSSKALEEEYEEENIAEKLRNHSLFVGYAPYDAPEIAFVVVGENQGGGSGFAAELSGEIVEKYLGIQKEKGEQH